MTDITNKSEVHRLAATLIEELNYTKRCELVGLAGF